MSNLLTLDQVKELTRSIQTEILESPAFLSADLFNKYGVRVLTGVEYKNVQFALKRKGGTTRPYNASKTVSNTLGKVEQKELVVKLAMNRFVDNIQNYREKEPFHVDTEGKYIAPNSMGNIRQICNEFTDDVISNFFYGKYNVDSTYGSLSLYDGIFAQLDTKLADKRIKTGPFAPTTAATASDNWEIVVNFVNHLPASLKQAARTADGVYIHMSPASKALVLDSYGRTFPALKPTEISDVDIKFLNLGNYHFIDNDLLGEGSLMFATTDGNLEFGVDSLNNQASVEVDRDNNDFNNIIYQIQSAQGTRVLDLPKVAVNDQVNVFTPSDYNGDYMDTTDNVVMVFSPKNGLMKKTEYDTKIADSTITEE